MGKRIKVIQDEVLVSNRVHELDPELPITTSQAGLLLACGSTGMAERKRSGRPPPARQPNGIGTRVFYYLGDVLAARRSDPAPTNAQARAAREDEIRGFPTFAAFVAEGHLTDQWPFAIVEGRPIDFLASLGMKLPEDADCNWLTLGQYVDMLKQAATEQEAKASNEGMEARTGEVPIRAPRDGGRI